MTEFTKIVDDTERDSRTHHSMLQTVPTRFNNTPPQRSVAQTHGTVSSNLGSTRDHSFKVGLVTGVGYHVDDPIIDGFHLNEAADRRKLLLHIEQTSKHSPERNAFLRGSLQTMLNDYELTMSHFGAGSNDLATRTSLADGILQRLRTMQIQNADTQVPHGLRSEDTPGSWAGASSCLCSLVEAVADGEHGLAATRGIFCLVLSIDTPLESYASRKGLELSAFSICANIRNSKAVASTTATSVCGASNVITRSSCPVGPTVLRPIASREDEGSKAQSRGPSTLKKA